MNNIAYIDGIKVDLETASLYHDVKSKLALGFYLTQKERSFYLLFMASIEEAKEYLRNEKKRKEKENR